MNGGGIMGIMGKKPGGPRPRPRPRPRCFMPGTLVRLGDTCSHSHTQGRLLITCCSNPAGRPGECSAQAKEPYTLCSSYRQVSWKQQGGAHTNTWCKSLDLCVNSPPIPYCIQHQAMMNLPLCQHLPPMPQLVPADHQPTPTYPPINTARDRARQYTP